MSMEIGWWKRDPELGKYQLRATIHGGNIEWTRKQGHHTPWEPYAPVTDEDWDRMIAEAETRVPRRLISPKQFAAIKALRDR
jgi:hypothetical protein